MVGEEEDRVGEGGGDERGCTDCEVGESECGSEVILLL